MSLAWHDGCHDSPDLIHGKQASIINTVTGARQDHNESLARCQQSKGWQKIVTDVAGTIRKMPLWKLQRVGDEMLDFMYENVGTGTTITLRPGIAYCLRAYYALITDLVRGAWVRYIQKQNATLLGNVTELRSFLFGTDRVPLKVYRPILRDLQQDRCFYCRGKLSEAIEVDHFIPWARYPVDLGHNFVLAHGKCNGAKSDHLAQLEHIEAWSQRNAEHGALLAEQFDTVRAVHDLDKSLRVANWAYSQVSQVRGQVWVRGRIMEPLGEGWRELLK